MSEVEHKGLSSRRISFNPREAVFAKRWSAEQVVSMPGRRNGTLQMLIHPDGSGGCVEEVTQTEASVAATVVQWLGSPVGLSFLADCLKECGYELESIAERRR